jgi:hypothetical protein
MGSIVDHKVLILIFPKGVDGILAAIFCFAGCLSIGTEGSIVSRRQVMKYQRSLLKGHSAGIHAGRPDSPCQLVYGFSVSQSP